MTCLVVTHIFALGLGIFLMIEATSGYNILLATMGGSRSHTVPFAALGMNLKSRGHNVTLLSPYSGVAENNSFHELVPPLLKDYIRNHSYEYNFVSARFRNEIPDYPWRAIIYAWKSCDSLLVDTKSIARLRKPDGDPQRRWDIAVVDGFYPECLLGILHGENVPTIMLNTLALCSKTIVQQGNPSPWSVTPFFGRPTTQDMTFFQRVLNAGILISFNSLYWFTLTIILRPTLQKHLGDQVPDLYSLTREIPLTLHYGHYSVVDSKPYMSNVVNVACLHCRPAMQLSSDLDSFLQRGFVYVSMGTAVQAFRMPDDLRQIFLAVFSTLPYNVIWKWEGGKIEDLPENVRTDKWWSQQDLLGHSKIRAFVSHGGMFSLQEAAYHGVPTLVLPIYCDQNGNAAQAEKLGYALVKDLAGISIDVLREGILEVVALHNNSYRKAAKKRSALLRDVPMEHRELATWWVEHVAKHGGADHLKSSTRYMGVMHYYCLDVALFYMLILILIIYGLKKLCWRTTNRQDFFKKKVN